MTHPLPESVLVRVVGHPVGQGNIDFRNGHGVHANAETLQPWRGAVSAAAQAAARTHRYIARSGAPKTCAVCRKERLKHALYFEGGVIVEACLYMPRRPSQANDEVPVKRTTQDVDHHGRAILDALTDAQVYRDDSQVVDLHSYQRFVPDGALPGATILVRPYRADQDAVPLYLEARRAALPSAVR
jgi:Holliday junction resolvase RusA-like endonuclease